MRFNSLYNALIYQQADLTHRQLKLIKGVFVVINKDVK